MMESQLQGMQDDVEQMQKFSMPAPPQLPIDSMMFDGASEVFEHRNDEDDQES